MCDAVVVAESDTVGDVDALAADDREDFGDVVTVVEAETVDEGVFDGVDVPVGVFEPVGVCVIDREAVDVVESDTVGVWDALAADDREAVGEVVIVVEAETVVDGVFGGVPVLDGVLVPVGVCV